jgi:type II secretion system protein H
MKRRAFSLIELILVMAVLAVAVATVGPMLAKFFRGRALDSEARRLLSLTRAGQSRAVSEGLPVLLWVDAPGRAYGLEQETAGGAADPKSLAFSLEENVALEVVGAALLPLNGRRLPAIRFLPDGSTDESSPAALRLSGADGATLWLARTDGGRSYEIRDNR